MEKFEGLTQVEMSLVEFGTDKEQLDYLVGRLSHQTGVQNRKSLYQVIGMAKKKFGFKTTALSIRALYDVTEESLFGKVLYACSSYDTAEKSALSESQQRESVETYLKVNEVATNIREYNELMSNPVASLLGLLMKHRITREQYEDGIASEASAKALIQSLYGVTYGSEA